MMLELGRVGALKSSNYDVGGVTLWASMDVFRGSGLIISIELRLIALYGCGLTLTLLELGYLSQKTQL
jgi:hypothetical protein